MFEDNIDLSGSYVGGSAKLNNIKDFNANLILDGAYFDKRICLKDTYPQYLSFVGANLSGFNVPDHWQFSGHQLKIPINSMKFVIHDDYLRNINPAGAKLPYNTLKAYWQDSMTDFLNILTKFME